MAIGGGLVDNRVGLAYDLEVLASVPAASTNSKSTIIE